MRRLHAPEIEDEPWCPRPLRDACTAFLQVAAERGRFLHQAAPVLQGVLERSGETKVVDLCSGGGGALLSLLERLPREVSATLTDLYPNEAAFRAAELRAPGRVHGRRASVDATDVPDELRGVRTIFNALHHFRPEAARRMVADAVAKGQPFCAFEVVERRPQTMLTISMVPFAVWASAPLQPGFDLFRFLLTYPVPVIPALVWWDGMCSCLRGYSVPELEELVAGLAHEGYRFTISQSRGVFLRVTSLVGEPVRPTAG
ncbi:MAG: class I SAM-dependent methyltransferase [Deltaproteobacteria bacterium]|nr:class I SAM-dependent methyltransferase [Deltaproteobacteria bacterium]